MADLETCLHCGDTRAQSKEPGRICGIESRGETIELVEEFANHRWADWRDAELEHFGVKPEAYERHRRTPIMDFQWIACVDTVRGHRLLTEADFEGDGAEIWRGMKPGQCIACGYGTSS